MKSVFRIGTGVFGQGAPKICVPIVEESREEIWEKAEEIAGLPADLAEWRADFYKDVFDTEKTAAVLKGVKERLGDKGLLFTFRTKGEGGSRAVGPDAYDRLNEAAALAGADLVDVEVFFEEEWSGERIRRLQEAGTRVLASNHDFQKTPAVEEMVRRLLRMEELGADAAKLAVMPVKRQDVLNLLQATLTAHEKLSVPVVTMSMGAPGMISRICGGLTGSAMTFASAGTASAPGQIPVESAAKIQKLLNEETAM